MQTPLISIVSPVYRAEGLVPELVSRLAKVLITITTDYEIILVEDGSPDRSWEKIEEACKSSTKIKGIKLSRNFGQHYAITAGLDQAKGQWVVVMDCDLQDRPEEIPNLYQEAQKGFDIVFARRVFRQDNFLKKQTSKIFYKIFSYLSGVKYDGSIANFGIYNQKVINAINSLREPLRAFSPMARWVGFKRSFVDVVHGERFSGKSSYTYSKLIELAFDICLAYSDRPLKITVKLGFFIFILSIFLAILTLFSYFAGIISVSGYTSIILSISIFSGLIIFTLGILGLYIGKIFECAKNRPLFIADKKINF